MSPADAGADAVVFFSSSHDHPADEVGKNLVTAAGKSCTKFSERLRSGDSSSRRRKI
jgi:hypothetical protein